MPAAPAAPPLETVECAAAAVRWTPAGPSMAPDGAPLLSPPPCSGLHFYAAKWSMLSACVTWQIAFPPIGL